MTEKDIECNRIEVQQLVMSLVRVGKKIKLTLEKFYEILLNHSFIILGGWFGFVNAPRNTVSKTHLPSNILLTRICIIKQH